MIGMTKVKNMFAGQDYEFALHNIRINGRMHGCSGYIKNPQTGKVVYLTKNMARKPTVLTVGRIALKE